MFPAILLDFGLCKPIGLLDWLFHASAIEVTGYRVNRVLSRSKPILSLGSLDRYRDLPPVRYQYRARESRRVNRYQNFERTAYLLGSEPEPRGPGPKSIFNACTGVQPLRNRGPPVLSIAHS